MKDQPKPLTPKLRFPEFAEQPLQMLQLRDLTAESTVRNGQTLPVSLVMGVTKDQGIVPMEERLIASDIARYKLVRKDWFAYNPMRLNIGSVARWKGDHDILVSPDYVVFKCLEDAEATIYPAYLDHLRQTDAWRNFVREGGDGGVRVRIYYEDIARLQLALPSPAEQRKIAESLTSLDEVIAAEGRKLKALRAHKKGLMQQLFPLEGESGPRLRFPEFRDAGEWRSRPLSGYFEPIRNGFVGTATPSYVSRGVPYLQGKNIKEGRIDPAGLVRISKEFHEKQVKSQLDRNDILMVQSGHVGECAVVGAEYEGGNCHALIILSPREGVHSPFFARFFSSSHGKDKIAAITTGNTIKHILATEVKAVEVCAPDFAEQQRIASFLGSLNDWIAAQSRKLDGLRAHKKGIMQQLFPSPERA